MSDDTHQRGNPALPAITALLLTRGCHPNALDTAYDWLSHQHIPALPSEVLPMFDEAIAIANAITPRPQYCTHCAVVSLTTSSTCPSCGAAYPPPGGTP